MSSVKTRRSTIKDVAAEADVSISTVSLVMNGKGYVSDETRARVQAVAQQLGYVPRQAARQLASQHTGNVGFVLRADHFTRSEPFYTRIFLGSEFEAHNRQLYVLLTTVPSAYTSGQDTPRFLREHNVDGVIVAGKVHPDLIAEIETTQLPLVLVDYETGTHPAVVIDNQQGGRIAVEHLLARGHRRIGFLGADLSHPSLQARFAGYHLALSQAGLSADPALILTHEAEPTRATGRALGQQLLNLEAAPTAVFCVNDAVALGAMDGVQQHGWRIPDDLAFVGFDDVPGAQHSQPPLTTVRVFKEQLGELALRYLHERIHTPPQRRPFSHGAHTINVPGELVVRAST